MAGLGFLFGLLLVIWIGYWYKQWITEKSPKNLFFTLLGVLLFGIVVWSSPQSGRFFGGLVPVGIAVYYGNKHRVEIWEWLGPKYETNVKSHVDKVRDKINGAESPSADDSPSADSETPEDKTDK